MQMRGGDIVFDRGAEKNKMSLRAQNPRLVAEVTDILIKQFNQVLMARPDLHVVDGFWIAHNFHKTIIEDLERRLGPKSNVRDAAWKVMRDKLKNKALIV